MFLFIFRLVRKIGLFFGFEICDAKSVCFLESGGARLRDDNSFTNFNHLNKLNFMFTANDRKTLKNRKLKMKEVIFRNFII